MSVDIETDAELEATSANKPKEPKIDDSGLIEIAEKRKANIDLRRKRFMIVAKILITISLLVVFVFVVLVIIKQSEKVSPSPYVITPATTITPSVTTIDDTNVGNWTLYRSDIQKIFIKHPINTELFEAQSPATRLALIYDKNNSKPTLESETSFSDGYIFKVTPLNVGIRNIESITRIKQDSFKTGCPATAVFGNVHGRKVSTIDSLSFDITNCNGDYTVNYVPRFGIYYELVGIYRGDFGYRQKYRAIIDKIVENFRFFPEDTEPVGPFKTFIDEEHKFLFAHPNLDEKCCQTPTPPIQNVQTIINLGDRLTYVDKNNFDGIGVYLANLTEPRSLEEFVDAQKNQLIEDYKVVKGVDPVTQESRIKVGKLDAIRLKGFSWQNNDLIYILTGNEYFKKLYVLSIMNKSGDTWEAKMQELLNSFETF